jgi:branched-subunit amino acid aminotransferase/4-amino-4-deoxychorismate lyase
MLTVRDVSADLINEHRMKVRAINKNNFFACLREQERPWRDNYLAMYATTWQGITIDPDLMVVPIDDHLVHRGDGVFDVMRCVRGRIYRMEAHLRRLERSAKAISLQLPPEYDRIREVIKTLVRAGGEKECLIRVTLSRGPGSFSTNPYDCPRSHIYASAVRYKQYPETLYRKGIQLMTSRIPVKSPFFARIKSCNYLPNVLMTKEAVDAGYEYAVAMDDDGFLAEGATENIGVVTRDGVLEFPEFERTLSGTTADRIFELAGHLVREGTLRNVRFARVRPQDAYEAREVLLTGTSLNVMPVVAYDGRAIGEGTPGPVHARLSDLLWHDMTENELLLTPIDWGSEWAEPEAQA